MTSPSSFDFSFRCEPLIRQRFDADVLLIGHALQLGVVGLQADAAAAEVFTLAVADVGRLRVVDDCLIVDFDHDVLAFDFDRLLLSLIVLGLCLVELHEVVQAAGFDRVAVAHVDLRHWIAGLGITVLLVVGVEMECRSCVRARRRHHVRFQDEILELVITEKMGGRRCA